MAKQKKQLVDQSEALSDFFESLMRDVDAYEDPSTIAIDTIATTNQQDSPRAVDNNVSEPEASISDVTDPVITQAQLSPVSLPEHQTISTEPNNKLFETLPPVMPEPVVVEETKLEVEVPTQTPAPVPVTEAEQSTESEELPDWCQHEFQAMLFKVAGLTLAVPLVDLNGVVECDLEDVSALPGHADFYLGLMKHLDKNVPLVDTARFVLPADKLSTLAGDEPSERITRVVMIHDCQYGLACDEVNEVITLNPDEVRWRTQRTQRRWLAGTVVEHMCALIDATAFAELLAARTPIQAFRE